MAPSSCYFTCEAVVEASFVPSTVGDVDCERNMVLVSPQFVGSVSDAVDRMFPRRPPLQGV